MQEWPGAGPFNHASRSRVDKTPPS